MKKFLISVPFILLADNLPFPPMPPKIPVQKDRPIKQKEEKKLPKECEILPPMLIFLPPPLEKDLIKCKNKLFIPNKKRAKEKLSKKYKNINIKSISIVEGFNQLYKIKTNKGMFYCNRDVSRCFKVVE